MTDEQFINLVTLGTTTLAVLIAIAAVLSGAYIAYVYRQRKEQALFLDLLVRICLRVTAAAAIGVGYIALALSGFSLGKPWGGLVVTLAFVLPLTVPITVALLWRKERMVKK